MFPDDRKYSKDHEWVRGEGAAVRVGITDFAQRELGDIVFVELPEIGKELRRGDTLGTIESVKAVSEIYAPVSGKVVAANDALTDKPETVNDDPHGEGWYCTIEPSSPEELDELMDAEAYRELAGA